MNRIVTQPPASATSPTLSGEQVLERRRSIRVLAIGTAWLLLGLVPVLAALPIASPHARNPATMAVALISAGALLVVGLWLLQASKPGWLTLTLDKRGFTFRRGRTVKRYEWDDLAGVEVTRRRNGRTQIPTVLITFSSRAALFLDDVFTLRPDDLATAMRKRCTESGNPWPGAPQAARVRTRRVRRRWIGWLILPLMATGLALAALLRTGVHPYG